MSVILVFIIFASLISLIFVSVDSTICGISEKVLFENNKWHDIKIVERSYGCGATDTDFPEYKVYKIVPIISLFNLVTKFDTSQIDLENWKLVND